MNMRILIAMLIGALLAACSAVVLVHDATKTRQAPALVLYSADFG